MEEQTLQFKENLINIRRTLVTNRKKIQKLSTKREAAEKQFEQEKKLRMREKMLETPRKINNAVSAGDAKKAKGMGLGNALGLFAIIIIATNFEKVKKLFNDFITGDTFKNIKNYFTGTIDFFKGLYSGLSGNYGELLGDKYDELVAFKDEKMEDIEKLTEYLKELQKNFEVLAEQAAEMRDKFLNLMGIEREKIGEFNNDEKPYGGLYEKGEDGEYYNIFDGSPLPENMKEENNTNGEVSSNNLGLSDYSSVAMNDDDFNFKNTLPFENIDPQNLDYDFAQYTDEDTNKDITIITKTNTVIT
tara:strand:+ start:574 stop:1482 length:909 start_codon:yes stop_codon:yes gene_type:complete